MIGLGGAHRVRVEFVFETNWVESVLGGLRVPGAEFESS
jgi:hypothetical protein